MRSILTGQMVSEMNWIWKFVMVNVGSIEDVGLNIECLESTLKKGIK